MNKFLSEFVRKYRKKLTHRWISDDSLETQFMVPREELVQLLDAIESIDTTTEQKEQP